MSKLTDLVAENRRLQRQVDYLAAETRRFEGRRADAAEAECARLRELLRRHGIAEEA